MLKFSLGCKSHHLHEQPGPSLPVCKRCGVRTPHTSRRVLWSMRSEIILAGRRAGELGEKEPPPSGLEFVWTKAMIFLLFSGPRDSGRVAYSGALCQAASLHPIFLGRCRRMGTASLHTVGSS